jgi:ParB/RepB/Spo0J family partition protein
MKAKKYSEQLPITKIRQSPFHFRKESAMEKMEDLAASIDSLGLIHAISVVDDGRGSYELINGHRRWLAHKHLKRKQIRSNIYEYEKDELDDEARRRQVVAEFLLAANKAEPLIPIERARYYAEAMDKFDWSVEDIARVHNVTVKSVQDDLVFLSLDDRVLDMVQASPDRFSTDHLRVLAENSSPTTRKAWRLEPDEQVKAAENLARQEDKEIVESPVAWESHVKGIVKKRRQAKAVANRKVGRGTEDPVKALFKLLDTTQKQLDELTKADVSSIKEIRPEDKGQVTQDLYAMAQQLIDFTEGPIQKLQTSKPAKSRDRQRRKSSPKAPLHAA